MTDSPKKPGRSQRRRIPDVANRRNCMVSTEQRTNRRELIIEAAAAIIVEGGLERVTFREIASKCGISKGVVEHHFADKADILRKTLEWVNRRGFEKEMRLTRRIRGLAAVRNRLRCILPLNAESSKEWKIRLHFWSMALANTDDQIGMEVRLAGARDRFAQDVREAAELGEISPNTDSIAAANMILHIIAGVACNMLINPSYYGREYRISLIDKIVANLRDGCI